MFLNEIKHYIFDLLFPSFCLGCHQEKGFICDQCFNRIKINKYPICAYCNQRLVNGGYNNHKSCRKHTNLTGLIIAGFNDDQLLHKLIYAYKYNFIQELSIPLAKILIQSTQNIFNNYDFEAHKAKNPITNNINSKNIIPLGKSIAQNICNNAGFERYDNQNNHNAQNVVLERKSIAQNICNNAGFERYDNLLFTSVPLHPKRLNWRGFNQSELLAKEISNYFHIPNNNQILNRRYNTLPQVKMPDRFERQKNIKDAFEINLENQSLIKSNVIFLIDDITTTGSTLEECAEKLKPFKPKQIWGMVLTKG